MTVKCSGIKYVMLGTSDMPRSLAYYREALGFRVKSETPGFAFLDTGAVTLCLSEPHSKLGEIAGASEVVLAVDGVREAYDELKTRGVVFLSEPMNVTGDSWAANFRDPDGHLLSVFGPERRA
jgi:catechol 2,3-dioxygenase-like lactoylglutathione lyase family enzyme